jgi:hypothetical protein
MKNKRQKWGLLLVMLFLALSGFSIQSVYANDGFFKNKKFTNHTYIGPFNISDSKTKQAKSKLASDFSKLQTKLEVNLIYQDIQFTLPPETIKFDIDMTLANAKSGEDNPIISTVSRDGLKTVLNQRLPSIQFSKDAIESVAAGIEKELQTGIMPRTVHITDYLANDIPNEVVASSEYSIDAISPALSKAIHALEGVVIEPYASFSMMDLLTSAELGQLTDEEMTLLSSTLYTTILQTNFQIDERNISNALPSTIQLGFEAAMNQTLGLDFKFTNPNRTEFTIRASWSAGVIHLSIEGKPFFYTYEPTTTHIETYKPRIVRQYSAFVNDGQVVVSQDGKEGVEAIVKRTLSVDGQVIDTVDISEDFYAPIHRIEIHPLSKGDASVTNSTDSEETNLSQNAGTASGKGSETSDRGEMDSGNSNNTNSSLDSDTADEESTGGKVIYDKSGLPISGK